MKRTSSLASKTRLMSMLIVLSVPFTTGAAQAGKGTLKGKIQDTKGKPIARADVRVMNSRDRSVTETHTDESGDYSIQLEPGEYTVTVDAEGFRGGSLTEMQQVEEGKETRVKTIALGKSKPTSLIRGTVFDGRGFGLAGVKVKLERIPTEDEEKERKRVESLNRDYVTNNRGEFAFRLPSIRARYRITAILAGYKTEMKIVDVGESEAAPVALTLETLAK